MSERDAILRLFDEARARTRQLFTIPSERVYYDRPIPLRHPIVFYEGHIPAFAINVLHKLALKKQGIDSDLEVLFARGIDPESETAVRDNPWPERSLVRAYVDEAERQLRDTLASCELEQPANPFWKHREAIHTILEHEWMHQETLLYLFHRLPLSEKAPIARQPLTVTAAWESEGVARVPAGVATLGAPRDRFGWDNEFPESRVTVPQFAIDVFNVTNESFFDFVNDGGYEEDRWWSAEGRAWRDAHSVRHPLFWEMHDGLWFWRGMFELIPLPPKWPVYTSWFEADAYARWRGGRLPTEAEYHRAAFGAPSGEERLHPWGDEPPSLVHGNFGLQQFDPVAVGSFPAGASGWGIHDLVGNGWEWTSTKFEPFDGFEPMATYPEYSADFFDGQHYVMKGASPATASQLVRRSFRNWFRPGYPYVYAKFRLVR